MKKRVIKKVGGNTGVSVQKVTTYPDGKDKVEVIEKDTVKSPEPPKAFENNSVGVSLGVTKNMGNYESLRVDVWTSEVPEKGKTKEETALKLSKDLEVVIDKIVEEITGE